MGSLVWEHKPHPVAFSVVLVSLVLMAVASWTHLLYAFNRNLLRLVMLQRGSVINGDCVELSEPQIAMMRTVRKHSLLGTIMLLCATVFVLVPMTGVAVLEERFLILAEESDPTNLIYAMVFNQLVLIALNICTVALYLGF